MPPREGDPFHQGVQRSSNGYQNKEYRARKHVCTGCPIRERCLGRSAQEKKFSVTYYRPIRTQHRKGRKSAGQVHEGQAAEYGGTRFRNPYPVDGPEEDKHDRARTGEQGDAPIGNRLQPEEVPEIPTRTIEKRGGGTCLGGIGEKNLSIAIWRLHKASKIRLQLLDRQEKSPAKGLILIRYLADQGLVQRLPLLAIVLYTASNSVFFISTEFFRRKTIFLVLFNFSK